MIGARWVVIGSVLAGCVFTPRPMIPLEGDETDSSNRATDASVSRDLGRPSDSSTPPPTDLGAVTDTAPPSFDASAGADIPGATTPDAGGAFDAGSFSDAAPAQDASAECDATGDGGDGGRCVEDVSSTDADASPSDAEAGLSGR
ncbi:MAG: hypothetical protein EPO40_36400 [Myxococcaceae bacterium]|nr:MAG: hypothetical protein EPO40_36400 [Myxococcaceae bacterium]